MKSYYYNWIIRGKPAITVEDIEYTNKDKTLIENAMDAHPEI